MRIDIVKLAEIIGACSVILGTILGGYKLYDRLLNRIDKLEDKVNNLEQELDRVKQEDTLVIYALGACLDGLHQQGCNGKVTEAMNKISKYINNAAHDQV